MPTCAGHRGCLAEETAAASQGCAEDASLIPHRFGRARGMPGEQSHPCCGRRQVRHIVPVLKPVHTGDQLFYTAADRGSVSAGLPSELAHAPRCAVPHHQGQPTVQAADCTCSCPPRSGAESRLWHGQRVSADFSARYSTVSKTYHYRVQTGVAYNPLMRRLSMWRPDLDVRLIRRAHSDLALVLPESAARPDMCLLTKLAA